MDALDMFGVDVAAFRAAFWLYGSTQGITALGPAFESPEEAQAALVSFAGDPLEFTSVQGQDLTYASEVWADRRNVAVVYRDTGTIECEASLPEGWYVPGDPRRPKSPS